MAAANVKPDSDGTVQWDMDPAGLADHYTYLDEGTSLGGGSPDDSNFVRTSTNNEYEEYGFEDSPGDAGQITQIDLHLRGQVNDTLNAAYIRLELYHSGGTPVTGNPKDVSQADLGGHGVTGEVTKTWSGLSLTKTQFDSLVLVQTFKTS